MWWKEMTHFACEVLQTTSTKYKSRSMERWSTTSSTPGSSMPILGFGCYKVGVGGSWIWSGAMGRFDFELVKYLWMGTSWNILFLHQKNRRGFSVLYLYAFFWAATRHSSILQLLSLEKRTFSVFDFRWWLYSQTLKRISAQTWGECSTIFGIGRSSDNKRATRQIEMVPQNTQDSDSKHAEATSTSEFQTVQQIYDKEIRTKTKIIKNTI